MEIERNRFNKSSFSKPKFDNFVMPTPKRLIKIDNINETKISTSNASIQAGNFVKHSIFGIGKVLDTSVVNGNEKADIDFGEKGLKSLLLKFAKLELLE
jgi:DNA helicase-2/ATP-dependent DNA helicase PcrA